MYRAFKRKGQRETDQQEVAAMKLLWKRRVGVESFSNSRRSHSIKLPGTAHVTPMDCLNGKPKSFAPKFFYRPTCTCILKVLLHIL